MPSEQPEIEGIQLVEDSRNMAGLLLLVAQSMEHRSRCACAPTSGVTISGCHRPSC